MDNIGLYIDADNISSKLANDIFEKIDTLGNFSIKKIFADWSKTESKSWAKIIEKYGLEPIQCFRHNKKQSTDIYLITQVTSDTFFYPRIDHFILATSDSDFIHLCQNLKKLGKTVSIFGNQNSVLQNYCDFYYNLSIKKTINTIPGIDEKVLIESMDDSTIISFTKFKKKKLIKKLNKNHLEEFLKNSINLRLYQKSKGRKIYLLNLEYIISNFNSKNLYYSNNDIIKKKYKDLLRVVDFDQLADLIY
jgi:uncharacterized LabA/DUF88 family protein